MDVRSRLTGRRGVALPFSDACEPFGFSGEASSQMFGALRQLAEARRWRYVEIRNGACLGSQFPASSTYLRHTLDLSSGADTMFPQFKGTVRTAVRKAQAAGVRVSFSCTLDAVRGFFRLNCMTRRRHGLPPQPFLFFKNLQEKVLAQGKGMVVTAEIDGRPIAASVYCHIGDQALFKYGASDSRFQSLRGSSLVMWEAIKWYAERGYRQMSLGRTAPGNEGLRRFKLAWGGTESALTYARYDCRQRRFVSGDRRDDDAGYAWAKLLPLSVLRLAGRALYRHMG
jgi:lipid II:glycine glycyltransferase (peptidoglycan interpeptide bridge formation enzyme)